MVLRLPEPIHNPLEKKKKQAGETRCDISHWAYIVRMEEQKKEDKTHKESSGITNTTLFSKSPSQQDHARALCKPKMGVRALIIHFSMG